MTTPDYTTNDVSRFWSKVIITADNDLCWKWTGKPNPNGYGRFYLKKMIIASRISWLFTYGYLPDDLEVCHSCDNPICVNPKHLFLGTHGDNVRDMYKKGRGHNTKGVNNNRHKLTEDDVKYIRERYAQGDTSMRQLAKEMNVVMTAINKIILRQNWKHVH